MTKEDIHKLENKIKVLEQKKKALEFKISNENRRSRTRRLIQKGALLEKYLENEESVPTKDTENLLKILAEYIKKNKESICRQIQEMKEDTEV